MNKARKICVVTGTRAEYGLLYWLMKEIDQADDLELQLVVTGMHLAPEFGLTYRQIEADGFTISRRVEMLLSSDSSTGTAKSMGLAMTGFADVFADLEPDLVVVLGDRFEIFAAASVATVVRIPIAHLHGGETTEGAFDESFRHSITKMSHLHFVAAEEYRRRVVQLGEHPDRIYVVGAPGIDNIVRSNLLKKEKLEESVGFVFGKRNLLVTFHPVTLEQSTSQAQFKELLQALDLLEDMNVIFTKANADPDGRAINQMIDEYVEAHSSTCIARNSLGQLNFLSAMQYIDGVLGNSSSGLIEAPSFRVGVVNIGDRQRGRIKAKNVVDCTPDCNSILEATQKIISQEFKDGLKGMSNPYGDGSAVEKILNVIRDYPLNKKDTLKKRFFDLEVVL
ncbi:MAG: UDP-N-acetylglucosamine 2-epimerase (hydrolyzing) [Gammaproteobacteria bacterium]|nr:UDP-N-acetylglucosamine 2-epimerase (hydrolyzing) [Gammaproteobacteria bacterium]